MKFGLVISMWLFMCPIFAQNCEEISIGSVKYFEGSGEDKTEIETFFVPCSQTPTLTFSLPATIDTDFNDPVPDTRAGVILVLLREEPGQSVLTVAEFSDLLYRDVNDNTIYYTDPAEVIAVNELLSIGNTHNQFILVPILVTNLEGNGPESWFEHDCVQLIPNQGLTLIENPVQGYEFRKFDEITFSRWPAEVPITDYFDISFTNQESGEKIPHTMTDNRSFRLGFSKAEGIFRFEIAWKNSDCSELEIGVNWSFPTVELVMDTVRGFRNIETCVPVRGYHFESITGFQFSMMWNSDSLDFTAIKAIHPDLADHIQISDIQSSGGKSSVLLEWSGGSEPITIPDSAILFEWCGKPLGTAGQFVSMSLSSGNEEPESWFEIYELETDHLTSSGGIEIQEDRELSYQLTQLCNTREGKHRIQVEITSEDAYPYTYSFHSDVVVDSVITQAPLVIPEVPPGQYEFTLRDSFGFEKTGMFTVREHIEPGFEINVDTSQVVKPTCLNPFGGEIGITISPADQAYDLDFINDDAVFSDQRAIGLVAGTYIIEAENQSGCIDTIHFRLPNPREIDVGWEADNLVLCPGESDVVLEIEDRSFPPDASIEYQLGGSEPMKVGEPYAITEPGIYPLQFWNDDGCTLDTNVVVHASPDEMVIWDTGAVVVLLGDTLAFSSPDPEGLTQISWEFEGQSTGDETEIRYTPEHSGTLAYTATVFERCIYRDSLWVEVINPNPGTVDYNFPNAFSPNGDGINDVYTITPTREIRLIRRMEIYDRYGNDIFEMNYREESEAIPGWDGRSFGVDVPAGIYPVVVELELYGGRQEIVSFDVMLLR